MDEQLSEQQISFFKTFGYLNLAGLLKEENGQITQAFEDVWAQAGGGHNGAAHDATQRSSMVQFIDRHEALSALLANPKITGAVSSLLGDDFNYIGSGAALHAGNTGWHTDGRYEGLFLRMIIYLDPLTRDTGCLRVVPGSHSTDTFSEVMSQTVGDSMKHWGIEPSAVPAVALETQPGDVILMVSSLHHASFGGSGRRRRMGLNFCKRCETETELRELKTWIGEFARLWIDEMFLPEFVARSTPDVKRRLQQVLDNQSHLRVLAAKCRSEMKEPSRY